MTQELNTQLCASRHIFIASQIGAKLDSDVSTGGGTDDTEILQAVLDLAPQLGSVHLLMDGAALVRGLSIHSNTTIECLNASCGFFLVPQTNGAVIKNAHPVMHGQIFDRHIALLGGTYNQDCLHQQHHLLEDGQERWVLGMEFYGVEDFTMRGITIRNQRTFALLMANWRRVIIDDVTIDLPDRMHAENQDGLHFWGPGQFLTIRNIQGTAGDDFIALAPDENDSVSSITDVLIDGVYFDDADQGIRLLSRGAGRLDRVVIRNVTGTYRSFGFWVNPWFGDNTGGNYGKIVFDTIDLRASAPNYDYTTPFLFRIGGRHESLTFRNIMHHNPADNRSLIEVGWPNADQNAHVLDTFIGTLTVEGLQISESDSRSADASYIKVLGHVGRMILRDVSVTRSAEMPIAGCLLETMKHAEIQTLMMHDISVNRMGSLLRHETGAIGVAQVSNVLCVECGDAVLSVRDGEIGQLNANNVAGAPLLVCTGNGSVNAHNEG